MSKHVKRLLSFVTRKQSTSFEYNKDRDITATNTLCSGRKGLSTGDFNSEVILDPANLADPCSSSPSCQISGRDSAIKGNSVELNSDSSKQGEGISNATVVGYRGCNDSILVKKNMTSSSKTAISSQTTTMTTSQCDVISGSGGGDDRNNVSCSHDGVCYDMSGGSGSCGSGGGGGGGGSVTKQSCDNTALNVKDLQAISFEDETPRLSDEVELTEDQKAELKQAFSMFEKTGKGRIQARDLGELLRCLGWNPSEQDLEEARHELELSTRGTISFSEVEAYIARRGGIYYGNNAEEDIMVAFQVLDKTGSGKITVSDFRHFMTTMGERMSHEEVEELIECSTRGGKDYIEYRDLLHAVQQSPT